MPENGIFQAFFEFFALVETAPTPKFNVYVKFLPYTLKTGFQETLRPTSAA